MTKYGYARVSTASQSTKEQIQQLLENGVEKKNIFQKNLRVQNGSAKIQSAVGWSEAWR